MSLHKESFFNRRNWLFEQLETLDLTTEEALCILCIDYLNEFKKVVNVPVLASKLKLEGEQVDLILNNLINKGYLKMEMLNRSISYCIDGVFIHTEDSKPCDMNQYQNLFTLYESEFARPLSQKESQTLSEWISIYELKLIEYALREALIYNSKNFSYIEKILMNWKDKNYTAKMYEERDN